MKKKKVRCNKKRRECVIDCHHAKVHEPMIENGERTCTARAECIDKNGDPIKIRCEKV